MRSSRARLAALSIPLLTAVPGLAQEDVWPPQSLPQLELRDAALQREFADAASRRLPAKAVARLDRARAAYEAGQGRLLALLRDMTATKRSAALSRDSREVDRLRARIDAAPRRQPISAQELPVGAPTLVAPSLGVESGAATTVPFGPVPPTLKDAADALPSVVEVYEWVRNAMAPEFYYGVMKGDVQAYLDQAGNDADTASVLVQMLRAKGVPARYVRGTVEMRGSTLMRLAGTANVEQAVRVLERAGIPYEIVLGGGGVAAVTVERIWTEAYLPYANYRGVIRDTQGAVWVPLDAAFKPLAPPVGLDAAGELGFVPEAAFDDYLASAQGATPLEFIRARLEAVLANRPGASYEDVLNRRVFGAEVHGLLPNTLPYRVVSVTERSYDLPDALVHGLRLTADRDGAGILDATLAVRDVLGRRLTLSYEPATGDDAEVVAAYGSLGGTPPYLFEVKPVIRSAGIEVAAGAPIGMGVPFTFRMEFTTPGGTRVVTNTAIAGNTTAIGLGGRQTAATEEGRSAAAEVLSGIADGYWRSWNEADAELADLTRVIPVRPTVSACLVGSAVEVEYAGGDPLYPIRYEWKGVLIDADLRASAPVGIDHLDRERQFLLLSGLQGSVLEDRVFETRHGVEAVSTAKVIGLAQSQGILVHEVTAANADAVLAGLPFDAVVHAETRDAVARGLRVLIPAQPVTHLAWTGVGYVIQDDATGAAAYQLQGGHSGGVTAPSVVDFPADLRDVLEFRSGEPKQDENRGVARLQKLQSTDFQFGTVNKPLGKPLRVLVTDAAGYPLADSWVTFSVMGGGGALANPRGGVQAEVDVRSDRDGIAQVTLLLGKRTDAIPRYLLPNAGEEHATQVGMNLVTARAELARIEDPFLAFALPDDRLDENGDSWAYLTLRTGTPAGWNANLRVATRLSIGAEDAYGNPLSNVPIRFAYRPLPVPVSPPGYVSLRDPTTSPGGVLSPGDYERCAALTAVVVKGSCAGEAAEVVVQSSALGAFTYPVLGGSPLSLYYFDIGTVRTPNVLEESYATTGPACFAATREECGDAGRLPHAWTSAGTRAVLVNTLGNLVEAYPPGGSATVGLWTDVVYEKERIVNRRDEETGEDHFFAESTNEWVREHLDNSEFELKPGTPGTSVGAAGSVGNGLYEASMTMSPLPLLNTVEWKATVRPKIIPYLREKSGETPQSEVDPRYVDNSNPVAPRLRQRVASSYTETFDGTFSLWAARARLASIDPAPIFLRENHTTAHDSSVQFAIEPAAFAENLLPVQVVFELRRGAETVLTANGSSLEAAGTFGIPADLPLAEGTYTAALSVLGVVGRDAQTMVSQPLPVEAGVVTLTVDTNNDTVVDDADDEAFRKDSSRAFAFWEADPEPAQELDALQDYATVRIRVPMALRPGETLALSMPSSRWVLRTKVGTGKDYLKDAATAEAQLASNANGVGQPTGPIQGRWEIPYFLLKQGWNEFLFRCEPLPDGRHGCPDATLTLRRIISTASLPLLAQRSVDVQPVNRWMTMYTARPQTSLPATPSPYSPLPRFVRLREWIDIPSEARQLTLLVHGFAVSHDEAANTFFPTFFKRLYWTGHPVLMRQGRDAGVMPHTVGISWPGNQGGDVRFFAFFPEDEFHALQSGVPLSRLIQDVLDKPSTRTIDIIAHSLGNMVVHSALLQPGMKGLVDRYIMNDAAVAADAFSSQYQYSTLEKSSMFAHAEQYGFGHNTSRLPTDQIWANDWNDMRQGKPYKATDRDPTVTEPDFSDLRNWTNKLDAELNPALFPQPRFELRWNQQRAGDQVPGRGASPTPDRGPWRGLFAGNLKRVAVLNAFNSGDQVLRIDGAFGPSPLDAHVWNLCQKLQKPNVGTLGLGPDSRAVQYWALLSDTSATQEYLWGFTGASHANVTRQWAELAYWFPSVSGAAGAGEVPDAINQDMLAYGGDNSFESHTYMGSRSFPAVWGAYELYGTFLRR